MDWLLNIFRRWRRRVLTSRFLKCLRDQATEGFLTLILKLMSLAFKLDKNYRKNIDGFTGKYQFRTRDNSVLTAVTFTGKDMKVKKDRTIRDPDITVIFKDSQSIMEYLLAGDRDILNLVLNNKVVLDGNMNYLMKFGYMANHLQLSLTGRLP